jgi:hypothetical protein
MIARLPKINEEHSLALFVWLEGERPGFIIRTARTAASSLKEDRSRKKRPGGAGLRDVSIQAVHKSL